MNNKAKKAVGLAAWGVVTVAVYVAAVNSHNASILSAVTYAFIALISLCAVLYAAVYVNVINLRKKAGVTPEEKFDFEKCGTLSEKDKAFLRKADFRIKLLVFTALPPVAVVLCDTVITMLI